MKGIDKELRKWTGEGVIWWMVFISKAIGRRSKPIKEVPLLQSSRPDLWAADLARVLWESTRGRIPEAAVREINAIVDGERDHIVDGLKPRDCQ